jgi:hypothetical protein
MLSLSAIKAPRIPPVSIRLKPSEIVEVDGSRELTWHPRRTLHANSDAIGPEESVVPPEVGDYTLRWVARAANMPQPTSGSLTISIRGPEHLPFTTMNQIRAFETVPVSGD